MINEIGHTPGKCRRQKRVERMPEEQERDEVTGLLRAIAVAMTLLYHFHPPLSRLCENLHCASLRAERSNPERCCGSLSIITLDCFGRCPRNDGNADFSQRFLRKGSEGGLFSPSFGGGWGEVLHSNNIIIRYSVT
jgi:hypothetical protein